MTRIVSTIGILLVATFAGCDFMSHSHCDDKVLSQQKSPDGRYIATLYHRSCANNTGLYTCVNVQEASKTGFSTDEIQPVLTIRGHHEIGAVWNGPSNLEINSAGLGDQKIILTQENAWKAVSISYKH